MDYKKLFEGVDMEKLMRDIGKFDLSKGYSDIGYGATPGLDFDMPGSAFQAPSQDMTARAKLGASFDQFDSLTAFRGKDIEQLVCLLVMRGAINPDNLEGEIVDFGTGTGAGAYVLQQYGGQVTGVDTSDSVTHAVEQGIFTPDRAVVGDGFKYLASLEPESLDFLSAFMMHHGFPHGRLYQESQRVLKNGGQLLITGGLMELKYELQRTVGRYGQVQDVLTVYKDGKTLGNVAFTCTKR